MQDSEGRARRMAVMHVTGRPGSRTVAFHLGVDGVKQHGRSVNATIEK
jgi:hypothetical protein